MKRRVTSILLWDDWWTMGRVRPIGRCVIPDSVRFIWPPWFLPRTARCCILRSALDGVPPSSDAYTTQHTNCLFGWLVKCIKLVQGKHPEPACPAERNPT
jgi:hypothetical protein